MKFYQTFWEVIKNDLMVMFRQLQGGELPPYKVNFGVITLLLKKENAVEIQQYRPICHSNASFNFFIKVRTNLGTLTSTQGSTVNDIGTLTSTQRGTTSPKKLTSFLYSPSIRAATPSTTLLLRLQGMSAHRFLLRYLFSLIVCAVPVVHEGTANI
jgi:hypothetical protein